MGSLTSNLNAKKIQPSCDLNNMDVVYKNFGKIQHNETLGQLYSILDMNFFAIVYHDAKTGKL